MAQLSVATLRLRGPPALAARAAWRAEEALRLAAPECERLLVLRHLPLGRLPISAGAAPWQARAETALREASGQAVHALSPGAAAAEAVWFASAQEARRLLLRELAAGRRPAAWFWRLAVPDWGGLPLEAWLPRQLAGALRAPADEVVLARIVIGLADTQSLLPVLSGLSQAPSAPRARAAERSRPRVHARLQEPAPEGAPREIAARVLARLGAVSRGQLLHALRHAPRLAEAARWLARLALLAASPELAARRDLLATLAEALSVEPTLLEPRPVQVAADGIEAAEAPKTAPPVAKLSSLAPSPPALRSPGRPAAPASVAPATIETPPLPEQADESRSRAAGVLLLLRPLERMGLPAWLDRHPDLAATGFARALLRHVAQRQRIVADDPLFLALGETRPQRPSALEAWRVGLDRWLRRRTRRRLADLARRGGWLRITEDSLAARFRADAADLNLRRLALDVDPGWVPWLGLVVRYHFRDHPLS